MILLKFIFFSLQHHLQEILLDIISPKRLSNAHQTYSLQQQHHNIQFINNIIPNIWEVIGSN